MWNRTFQQHGRWRVAQGKGRPRWFSDGVLWAAPRPRPRVRACVRVCVCACLVVVVVVVQYSSSSSSSSGGGVCVCVRCGVGGEAFNPTTRWPFHTTRLGRRGTRVCVCVCACSLTYGSKKSHRLLTTLEFRVIVGPARGPMGTIRSGRWRHDQGHGWQGGALAQGHSGRRRSQRQLHVW